MTYAVSASLQKSVYQALVADTALQGMIGDAIFDAPTSDATGARPGTYAVLGEEEVRTNHTMVEKGAIHDFSVTVFSDEFGYTKAKAVAGRISEVLTGSIPALETGTLVSLDYLKARASRGSSPERRRILLVFRAITEN